jgi:hypothetical protein
MIEKGWQRVHVARKGRRGMHMGFSWEDQKEIDHQEDQDVGGRLILKWILDRMV